MTTTYPVTSLQKAAIGSFALGKVTSIAVVALLFMGSPALGVVAATYFTLITASVVLALVDDRRRQA
jgi:hypothetical protein